MQSKCKAMQSNFIRLVFVLILSNYLIINKAVVSFRYAVFTDHNNATPLLPIWGKNMRYLKRSRQISKTQLTDICQLRFRRHNK